MDILERKDKAWVKFAAAALQGLISAYGPEEAAIRAAKFADEMLKEWVKR
jgi:hypothetical protein